MSHEVGLDTAYFTAEMDKQVYLQRVREQQRSGNASGAAALHMFFVNGRVVDAFRSYP